jgi:hypothetical protein
MKYILNRFCNEPIYRCSCENYTDNNKCWYSKSPHCGTNDNCYFFLYPEDIQPIINKDLKWAVQNLQSDNKNYRLIAELIIKDNIIIEDNPNRNTAKVDLQKYVDYINKKNNINEI